MKKLINKLKKEGYLDVKTIPNYCAIAAGVFALFAFGNIERQLLGITLLLSFITATLLIQYNSSINRIDEKTRILTERIGEADIFQIARATDFWDYAREHGEELFISGGSLHNVFADRVGYLNDILAKGVKLYIVIMRPESEAIKLLYNNVVARLEVSNLEAFTNNTIETIKMINGFRKKYPDMIEISFNDHVPSFGVFAAIADGEPIRIQVNLFSERISYDKRIAMIVNKDDRIQQDAYLYFKNQISLIKKRCKPATEEEIQKVLGISK